MPQDYSTTKARSHFGVRGVEAKPGSAAAATAGRHPASASRDDGEGKRSMIMTLVAVGAGAFGVWAFFNSGATKTAHGSIYASVDQCVAGGALSRAECTARWKDAQLLHEQNATRFGSKAECEEVHGEGRCGQTQNSRSMAGIFFIPRMTGYVMGRLQNGSYQAAPLFQNKGDGRSRFRMTAVPPPVSDGRGGRMSPFVKVTSGAAQGGPRGGANSTRRNGFGRTAASSNGPRSAGG